MAQALTIASVQYAGVATSRILPLQVRAEMTETASAPDDRDEWKAYWQAQGAQSIPLLCAVWRAHALPHDNH